MTFAEINSPEELRLAKEGDRAAFDRIIAANLGLVRSIASRFTGRGTEYEDLVQIGSLGLIKALKNFDLSAGTCFSTYAVPMVTGEIKKHPAIAVPPGRMPLFQYVIRLGPHGL